MRLLIFISVLLLTVLLPVALNAKFSMAKDTDYLEIGGTFGVYYNYRFYPPTAVDRDKNRFKLENATLQFSGLLYRIYKYEIQIDFSKFMTDRLTRSDIEPIIQDALVTIKLPVVDVTIGYHKIPYSRNSLNKAKLSPFLERPDLVDKAIPRRDVGITLHGGFLRQLVNVYAGVYNGTGSVVKFNDPSGFPEFCGRLEIAFPSAFKPETEIDLNLTPIPMVAVGGGIRYTRKSEDRINDPDDNYPVMIDGDKYIYGFDFSFQFGGLSFEVEAHQILGVVRSQADSMFIPSLYNNIPMNTFLCGGIIYQLNYFVKPIGSVFSVRYDDINPNSLVIGDTRRSITYAYGLLMGWMDSILRIQYTQRLPVKSTGLPWKDDEIRVGYELLI